MVHTIMGDAAAICPPVSGSAGSTALLLMSNCPAGSPIADDCIPMCESETRGNLLQLNVSGVCAKLTCELSVFSGVFSWVDDPLSGYIGDDPRSFIFAVGLHAASLFALTVSASVTTPTAADMGSADPRGQTTTILITVDQKMIALGAAAVLWAYTGSGAAFVVGTGAELQISDLGVSTTSGLAFSIADSSPVMMTTLRLQTGDSSRPWTTVSCLVLATGTQAVPLKAVPLCTDIGPGSVSLVGPPSISAQHVETVKIGGGVI